MALLLGVGHVLDLVLPEVAQCLARGEWQGDDREGLAEAVGEYRACRKCGGIDARPFADPQRGGAAGVVAQVVPLLLDRDGARRGQVMPDSRWPSSCAVAAGS